MSENKKTGFNLIVGWREYLPALSKFHLNMSLVFDSVQTRTPRSSYLFFLPLTKQQRSSCSACELSWRIDHTFKWMTRVHRQLHESWIFSHGQYIFEGSPAKAPLGSCWCHVVAHYSRQFQFGNLQPFFSCYESVPFSCYFLFRYCGSNLVVHRSEKSERG